MADSGQRKMKICFCIILLKEEEEPKQSRSTYAERGILAKGLLFSSVNKCIMSFCCPQIKEVYLNLQKIFQLICINELFVKYENIIFTGDLKVLNEVYGIMEASSKHPCVFCNAASQDLSAGSYRSLGGLRNDYENWQSSGGAKKDCMNYNNVKNLSLFESVPNKTLTLQLTPLPGLHIMLGIFNQLRKLNTSEKNNKTSS